MKVVRAVQFSNELASMEVPEKVTETRFLQLANTEPPKSYLPIELNASGITMLLRAEPAKNALPITLLLPFIAPKVTDSRAELANTPSTLKLVLSANTMLVIPVPAYI